jgi:hypothetical protein
MSSVSRTCKFFQYIAGNQRFWKTLDFEKEVKNYLVKKKGFFKSSVSFPSFGLKRSELVTNLIVKGLDEQLVGNSSFVKWITSFPNLTKLGTHILHS